MTPTDIMVITTIASTIPPDRTIAIVMSILLIIFTGLYIWQNYN